MHNKSIIIIGGGAAGFFAAIHAAELLPDAEVTILEKASAVLSKVRVSGGGRCNVTHDCMDVKQLVKYYPRGGKSLMGSFTRFGPVDTVEWFESRGVELKIENDGRMFPVTDNSETIINCLLDAAENAGVNLRYRTAVISMNKEEDGRWKLTLQDESTITADAVIVAAGSSNAVWEMLNRTGVKTVPPVPSLFTFHINDKALQELSGCVVPDAELKLEGTNIITTGPLLITHWGFSGPATLKLSAWAARELAEKKYAANIHVRWMPEQTLDTIREKITNARQQNPRKAVRNSFLFDALPKRLWEYLVLKAGIPGDQNWSDSNKQQLNKLTDALYRSIFPVSGKSTFKEEFVTCGGVDLTELDLRTMEAKRLPGLYIAGEVADVDAITGGFNFQWAWTSGYIAAEAIAASIGK